MGSQKSTKAMLLILLISRLGFDLDFLMIILFFNKFSETFQIEISYMGLLITLFSISTLSSPFFGNLTDKLGRRRFLMLGLATFALSSVIMVTANTWLNILIARILAGLSNAIFFPALLAVLGDKYSYEKRTRAMGIVRLSWPTAFVIGIPLVGYSIEFLSWRFPFAILAILALSSCIIIFLNESFKENSKSPEKSAHTDYIRFKKVLYNRSAIAGLVLMLLAAGSIEGIFAYFPTWMETNFLLRETEISVIYSFAGVGTLFGTLLATVVGDRFGPKRSAITGLVLATVCMVLLSNFSYHPLIVTIWLLLLGTFFDFSMTVIPVILTQLVFEAKGTVLSLNQALNACGMAVGTALSGFIWIYYGYSMIGLFFAFTAFIGALIGLIYIQIENNSETNEGNAIY